MFDIVGAMDRDNFSLYTDEALEAMIFFASRSRMNDLELEGLKVHPRQIQLLKDLGYIVIGCSGDSTVTVHW